ncbi:MAG TPA: helix-turn-helix transcriptional regulator [Patescibacteria group bacterium]
MKEFLQNTVLTLRKKNKMTQEELAKTLGVSRQTIVAIEKGHYMPSLILGIKIARLFKTGVEKIFIYKYEK